jgi:drug/metabolite transporter (DMT)-like permease
MQANKKNWVSWILFLLLSVIWGSSFILMKLGMYNDSGNAVLSPYQVAAIRLLSAGIVLIPFALKSFARIPKSKWGMVILSGLIGSFIPAFLFCIAETKIDSALAGALNALTPVFAVIIGVVFYKTTVPKKKLLGIFIALLGCFFLLFTKKVKSTDNTWFAGFVLLATILYGMNVNIVRHKLQEIGSLNIATVAFVALIIPSLFVLIITGYFNLPLSEPAYIKASFASALLGIGGTAIASIFFYMLVKRAGALFASMVTYGIPFIAILWGIIYGEHITMLQMVSLAIILIGVYLANK